MSDEQRKAMWANIRAGGGSGGSGSIFPGGVAGPGESTHATASPANQPIPISQSMQDINARLQAAGINVYAANDTPSRWDKFKASVGGFFSGAKGGTSILTSKLTYGLSDAVGLTDSNQYQGQDFDISRVAGTVAQTALTTAFGIGAIDKLGKAYAGTRLASSALGKLSSPIMTLAGFGTQSAINNFRTANPTLNPAADKALAMASELAGFVGAIGMVGTIGKAIGLLGKIPVSGKISEKTLLGLRIVTRNPKDPQGLRVISTLTKSGGATLGTVSRGVLGVTDKALRSFGAAVQKTIGRSSNAVLGKQVTARIGASLKKAYSSYQSFSDFTGSSIKDLLRTPKSASKLAQARALTKEAAKLTAEAQRITLQRTLSSNIAPANQFGQNLAGKYYFSTVRPLQETIPLTKKAAELTAKAANLAAEGKAGLKAAAWVAGISGLMAYNEERGLGKIGDWLGFGRGIQNYKQEAKTAFKAGEKFDFPMDTPRSTLGTITTAAIGTTGNPIEKWFRPGWPAEQAAVGVYRAKYELIDEAYRKGRITSAQRQAQLEQLAQHKPFRMQGRAIWDVAPAAATFLKWKLGDLIEDAKRSTIDQRAPGSYADADTIISRDNLARLDVWKDERETIKEQAAAAGVSGKQLKALLDAHERKRPGGIRLLDMDAPEVAHGPGANKIERQLGEFLGTEAAARMEQLVKSGQYFRKVEDSHPKAGGLDRYNREVRVIETLPKPFDQLLHVPVLGKIIPAVDVNKKLISEGYADIAYRALSGPTDRAMQYDAAREKAQAKGLGIWSPEAQEWYADFAKQYPSYEPWIGKEKTVEQRRTEKYQKQHGGALPPPQPANEWGDVLGAGLMTTGNSGIFGHMPDTGGSIAVTWNAVLAVLGALGYNEKANAAIPRSASPPRDIPTEYQVEMDALRRAQLDRIAELNRSTNSPPPQASAPAPASPTAYQEDMQALRQAQLDRIAELNAR